MVKLWGSLSWETVEYLCLIIYKIQVEQGPKKPNFRFGIAFHRMLDQMTSRGPFQLKFFYDYKYTYSIFKGSDSSQETIIPSCHFWNTDKPLLEMGTACFYEERLLSSRVPSPLRLWFSKAFLFLVQAVLMQQSTLRYVQLMSHGPKALEWSEEEKCRNLEKIKPN